jgi:hypothetical protein
MSGLMMLFYTPSVYLDIIPVRALNTEYISCLRINVFCGELN